MRTYFEILEFGIGWRYHNNKKNMIKLENRILKKSSFLCESYRILNFYPESSKFFLMAWLRSSSITTLHNNKRYGLAFGLFFLQIYSLQKSY